MQFMKYLNIVEGPSFGELCSRILNIATPIQSKNSRRLQNAIQGHNVQAVDAYRHIGNNSPGQVSAIQWQWNLSCSVGRC